MILDTPIQRIPSTRQRNQALLRAYLDALAAGKPLPPPAPNPNVLGITLPRLFDHVRYQRETYPRLTSHKWAAYGAFLFPATTVVPEVEMLISSLALTNLANAILVGTIALQLLDPGIPYNTVFTQSVPAGSVVGQNTIVNLVVQGYTLTPNVVDLDQFTAQADMIAAFFTVQFQPQVSSLPPGIVITQSVAAESQQLPNTLVILTIAIPGVGFRVRAVTAGYYSGEFRRPGAVFDLLNANDFSDSTQNYEIAGNESTNGWMVQVPSSTPLTQDDGSGFLFTADPNRRFVE
jgi:hypothetical protein